MAADELRFSDGEKLTVLMLCDLFKHLQVKDSVDPDFVAEMIYGGHYWALSWQYTGIFHDTMDSQEVLTEVLDMLDMWSLIERSYALLSDDDKSLVEDGVFLRFRGFDGNQEAEHLGIARVLIEKLDRFEEFKGRDLNSHAPLLAAYKRMMEAFRPIWDRMLRTSPRGFTATELTSILGASRHP